MDKLLFVNLQGHRKVSGYLRGFDIFLNLVLDEAREEGTADKVECGTVVSRHSPILSSSRGDHSRRELFADGTFGSTQVIRGNSVTSMELLAAR